MTTTQSGVDGGAVEFEAVHELAGEAGEFNHPGAGVGEFAQDRLRQGVPGSVVLH
ncbi:hypothetical protein [Streptomyces sp. 4N124]|uniref:hypothetical protein n=1 Tax=Streptomyces sp. 4N124 TaxID=3457420 RepID=UPI003FCF7A07